MKKIVTLMLTLLLMSLAMAGCRSQDQSEPEAETHPYYQSGEMKEHIAQYGTVLESWFPLGGRGNTQTLFNDETIASIAEAHGVSSAQVIIRWHLQAGNICIPGSSNEQHIKG